MSTNPPPKAPYLLAAEVEHLLQTKEDYLASSRSSAGLSALKTLYEELENTWLDLNTPPEEQSLQLATTNFEQKRTELRNSLLSIKDNIKRNKQQAAAKSQSLTLNSEQLIEQLIQKYSAEWQSAEARQKQQQQLLNESEVTYDARLKTLKELHTTNLTQQQLSLETKKQQQTQYLTELRQSYETSMQNATSLSEWRQSLMQKKQNLTIGRDSLKKVWSEQDRLYISLKELQKNQ